MKSLLCALSPVFFLISLLYITIQLVFGDSALDGGIQVSLLLGATFAGILSLSNGLKWSDLQKGIVESIGIAMPSILILLLIGAIAGTWLISGIIPSLVYYGLDIINPKYLLVASCLACSFVSLITGTSYATIATVGVALMGIGSVFGIHQGLIAGAIISGAYFGDKLSPLSDTTNLAPAVSGGDLFSHIRFMLWTTIPSISISLIIFFILGFGLETTHVSLEKINFIKAGISEHFIISPWLLIIPIITFGLIIKKTPAIPALLVSILLASPVAVFFQPKIINLLSNQPSSWNGFSIVYQSIYGAVDIPTSIPELERLFSTGGMQGMLNTIWLILCAMIFGGIMEKAGFLKTITLNLLKLAKNKPAIITSTALSSIGMNIIAADQYVSIILPGKMFSPAYKNNNLKPEALSRTLEDAGTVTSVLIPWNTCGITQATVLGVATWSYAPYSIFCWLSPVVTILFSIFRQNSLIKNQS